MIHWTPEGQAFKSGLNFYATWSKGRPWFRIVWLSVSLDYSPTATKHYLRFRTICRPWIIYEKSSWNILENTLRKFDRYCVSREEFLDFVKPNINA